MATVNNACPVCLAAPCRDREHAAFLGRLAAGQVRCSSPHLMERALVNGYVVAAYYSATAGPLCRACWIERFGAKKG